LSFIAVGICKLAPNLRALLKFKVARANRIYRCFLFTGTNGHDQVFPLAGMDAGDMSS
jgi:hypothetical protein